MLTIYDEIQQLRSELAGCIFTRGERAMAQAELDRLLALHAQEEAAFAALFIAEPPC